MVYYGNPLSLNLNQLSRVSFSRGSHRLLSFPITENHESSIVSRRFLDYSSTTELAAFSVFM